MEVLSPGDRESEVSAKVREWLDAGSRQVWVIDPPTRTMAVYESGGEASVLGESETLRPGTCCRDSACPWRNSSRKGRPRNS